MTRIYNPLLIKIVHPPYGAKPTDHSTKKPKEKKKTEPKAQSKVELESRIASIERMMVFLDNNELKKTNKQTIKSLKLLVKYAD